jgi:hypothetical protein
MIFVYPSRMLHRGPEMSFSATCSTWFAPSTNGQNLLVANSTCFVHRRRGPLGQLLQLRFEVLDIPVSKQKNSIESAPANLEAR